MDFYPILWNVHPGAAVAAEIFHIETFKPIIAKLRMLGSQSYPFNLQSEPIKFRITRPKYFPIRMCGNKQKPVFIQTIDTLEYILKVKLPNFSNILFSASNIKVVSSDCINFVLVANVFTVVSL